MKTPGYYTNSAAGFACIVCGQEYAGAWAKQDARRCCADKKPYSPAADILLQAEHILADARPPLPRQKRPGDKTKKPDAWGHRSRDKTRRTETQYHKSMELINRTAEDIKLAGVLGEYDPLAAYADKYLLKREASPWQRISFAHINHNWPALKAAVEDYGAAQVAAFKARVMKLLEDKS
jgi:hypothetical protein